MSRVLNLNHQGQRQPRPQLSTMPGRDLSAQKAPIIDLVSDSESDTVKRAKESAASKRKRDRNSGRAPSERLKEKSNENSQGGPFVNLVSDSDDDDEPTRRPNGRRRPGSKEPSPVPPPRGSQSILPIRKSTPQTVINTSPMVPSSSGPKVKFSPPSLSKAQHSTPQNTGRSFVEEVFRPPLPLESDDSDDVDEEVPVPISQNLRASPATPSKSSRSHHGSQKSGDSFTVATDSPLETRIKSRLSLRKKDEQFRCSESPREVMERRSKSADAPENPPPTIKELERSLEEFEKEMKEDHARDVRWLLSDAQDAVEETQTAVSKFLTDDLPFASMKGVQLRPGDTASHSLIDKWDHYIVNNKGKLVKSKSSLIATTITSDTPRVPKYSSHTNVQRNILSADDEKLKFIPYLGDPGGSSSKMGKFKRLVTELEEAYTAKRSESSRESERASQIRSYLDSWLKRLNLRYDQKALIQYILVQDQEIDELGLTTRESNLLLKSFPNPLSPEAEEVADMFSQAFDKVFKLALKDVILPGDRLKEMVESAIKAKRASIENPNDIKQADRLGTYATLTCLICGAVDCQTHGDYGQCRILQPDDSNEDSEEKEPEYQFEHTRFVMNYDDMLRRHKARKAVKPPQFDYERIAIKKSPCGEDCWMKARDSDPPYSLPIDTRDAIEKMLISITNKNTRSCTIAFTLDLPCWQVYHSIERYEEAFGEQSEEEEETSKARPKRPDWYDNKRKVLKGDWMDMTSAHLHQERCQANPCAHEGPCLAGCPCFDSNILCENFCGCSDDCPRRFTGCACASTYGITCATDTCLCIQMNRECGPECGSCGAVARIDPANKHDDELFTSGCQNVYLQRGVSKAMIMGESQLEGVGFGLYLGEPVSKGDFLSEYAGEVISFNEADRRGIIYDRKYMSFLFDLNSEWCIDAARLGNKTRFINHADNEKNGLNCEAKIVLVNGEHRIKFSALRDIAVGEELLFNYGKKFAEKHGLSKILPKAKEGGKKGVLEGEEALDALDGMDNRKMRGKMMAKRGGHSGSGRGKKRLRKAAVASIRDPLQAAVELVREEEDMYGTPQEEEDDEEDEDTGDGRRHRKTRRPMRYTR